MPVMESITEQICDSLNQLGPKVEQLSKIDYQLLMSVIIMKQSLPWTKEMIAYQEKSGRQTSEYESYFNHYLEVICPIYRKIAPKLDSYMEGADAEREQYFIAKAFVGGLEDGAKNDVLRDFFDESQQKRIQDKDLDFLRSEIAAFKTTSILIVMFVDNKIFRIRYFHYLTDDPLLQIDLLFEDLSDLKVDGWEIKENKQLMKEKKEREKTMNDPAKFLESLPPPPPLED